MLWRMSESLAISDRITGSLLGGAVGDALGAAVEFSSLVSIREVFGPNGITEMAHIHGRVGGITDDTQMTLFTAEGVIRDRYRQLNCGGFDRVQVMHRAYLRWLETQEKSSSHSAFGESLNPGWLGGLGELHCRRAPGNTCLAALAEGSDRGIGKPVNNSKGCGGVMRVAPIGTTSSDPRDAFLFGCEAAAITHSHATGYLASGFLASVICCVLGGAALDRAIGDTLSILRGWDGHAETESAVEDAVRLAGQGGPDAGLVEVLGGGWIAEEALAIGLYCALATGSLEEAVILAVNHSGDSDSTGSIAGNIVGAISGPAAIPDRWLEKLELRDAIETIAADLHRCFHDPDFTPTEEDLQRYPPN